MVPWFLYLTDYGSCVVACSPLVLCSLLTMENVCVACGPLVLCFLLTMEAVWPVVLWFSVPY